MSNVTDVILLLSLVEEQDDDGTMMALDSLNASMVACGLPAFVRVDHMAGGGKSFQSAVFLLAGNDLKGSVLAELVRRQAWCDPTSVQLFVKYEEDERFQIVC